MPQNGDGTGSRMIILFFINKYNNKYADGTLNFAQNKQC